MVPKNKKERRRERLRLEEDERRLLALTTPRDPRTEIDYRAVGHLRFQLVIRPSFKPTRCWEIRGREELQLYLSQGSKPGELVKGHEAIDIPQEKLLSILEEVGKIQLPLLIEPVSMGVLDGMLMEICVAGNYYAECRCTWIHSLPPRGWEPLEALANRVLDLFTAASPAVPEQIEDAGPSDSV